MTRREDSISSSSCQSPLTFIDSYLLIQIICELYVGEYNFLQVSSDLLNFQSLREHPVSYVPCVL